MHFYDLVWPSTANRVWLECACTSCACRMTKRSVFQTSGRRFTSVWWIVTTVVCLKNSKTLSPRSWCQHSSRRRFVVCHIVCLWVCVFVCLSQKINIMVSLLKLNYLLWGVVDKIVVVTSDLLQSWGKELDSNGSKITDFMETLEKFVDVLHGARGNMQGHVTLADTEQGTHLDNMKGPADYQAAGMQYWVVLLPVPILQ